MPDDKQISSASAPAVTRVGNDIGLNAPDAAFSSLTEMMRSFVVLADCLNLTHAVDRLQTTRQTVRRHIKLLETARGAPLFEVRDRQYSLTEAGRQALPEAEYIMGRSQAWYRGQIGRIAGLDSIRRSGPDPYYLQQQSISSLWAEPDSLLTRGIAAWCDAHGALDHPAMSAIKDSMIIFRRVRGEWICAEVGSQSAYAKWFGPTWERSSIGLPIRQLPGGRTFVRVANRSYDEIEITHGLRYDHLYTAATRGDEVGPQPFGLRRLLIGCRFADGSFALGNLALQSHDLNIDGLEPEVLQSGPDGSAEGSAMN